MTSRLELQLKSLKLTNILAHYQTEAQAAAQQRLSYEDYLARWVDLEAVAKLERSVNARIAKARFPTLKTIEGFDFSFQPQLNEKEIIRLTSLEFLENKENLLFLGPPGVGKTHLAIAFGVKACLAKYRVLFTTCQDLLANLLLAQKTNRLGQTLLQLARLDLLIVDELGYLPISPEQANLFFQLVSSRYEKGAMILTSNYGFEDWGPIFTDQVIATAIIDRLVHHSHIFAINGNSFRMRNHRRGRTQDKG
jgi:DNA replication protein DnaC